MPGRRRQCGGDNGGDEDGGGSNGGDEDNGDNDENVGGKQGTPADWMRCGESYWALRAWEGACLGYIKRDGTPQTHALLRR